MLIFSTFKSSEDYRAYNAVQSWKRIEPWWGQDVQVLLIGEETQALASELDVDCMPEVARNASGTPLLNDMYRIARRLYSDTGIFAYVNGDIILFDSFLVEPTKVAVDYNHFLVVGQRKDVQISGRLRFNDMWQLRLRHQAVHSPYLPACGADYFVFRQGMFENMPPFAIGRTSFDNWFIYDCLQEGLPVINGTTKILAIHQMHNENPELRGSEEAAQNRRLVEQMYPNWNPWRGWVSHATERL